MVGSGKVFLNSNLANGQQHPPPNGSVAPPRISILQRPPSTSYGAPPSINICPPRSGYGPLTVGEASRTPHPMPLMDLSVPPPRIDDFYYTLHNFPIKRDGTAVRIERIYELQVSPIVRPPALYVKMSKLQSRPNDKPLGCFLELTASDQMIRNAVNRLDKTLREYTPTGQRGDRQPINQDSLPLLRQHNVIALEKQVESFPDAVYYCTLCDHHLTSISHARAHFESTSHLNDEEKIRQRYNLVDNLPPLSAKHREALNRLFDGLLEREVPMTEDGQTTVLRSHMDNIASLLRDSIAKHFDVVSNEVEVCPYGSVFVESDDVRSDLNFLVGVAGCDMSDAMDRMQSIFGMFSGAGELQDLSSDAQLLEDIGLRIAFKFKGEFRVVLSWMNVKEKEKAAGYRIGRLLKRYTSIDPAVSRLMRLVRFWARLSRLDVSDRARPGLHRYGFDLMVVHYLLRHNYVQFIEDNNPAQCLEPPLPSNRSDRGASPLPCSMDNSMSVSCPNANFMDEYLQKIVPMPSLAELFVGFLGHYTKEHMEVVQLSSRLPMSKDETKWSRKNFQIADPSRPDNVVTFSKSFQVYFFNCFLSSFSYFALPRRRNGACPLNYRLFQKMGESPRKKKNKSQQQSADSSKKAVEKEKTKEKEEKVPDAVRALNISVDEETKDKDKGKEVEVEESVDDGIDDAMYEEKISNLLKRLSFDGIPLCDLQPGDVEIDEHSEGVYSRRAMFRWRRLLGAEEPREEISSSISAHGIDLSDFPPMPSKGGTPVSGKKAAVKRTPKGPAHKRKAVTEELAVSRELWLPTNEADLLEKEKNLIVNSPNFIPECADGIDRLRLEDDTQWPSVGSAGDNKVEVEAQGEFVNFVGVVSAVPQSSSEVVDVRDAEESCSMAAASSVDFVLPSSKPRSDTWMPSTPPGDADVTFDSMVSEDLSGENEEGGLTKDPREVDKTPEMALNVDPAAATFPASGGNATHNIVSMVEARHAFKVKSSNNDHYRVRPVYGFIDGKATVKLEIARSAGPAKDDKLIIQWAEVPAEETDAQAPFKAGAQSGEVILPLKAESGKDFVLPSESPSVCDVSKCESVETCIETIDSSGGGEARQAEERETAAEKEERNEPKGKICFEEFYLQMDADQISAEFIEKETADWSIEDYAYDFDTTNFNVGYLPELKCGNCEKTDHSTEQCPDMQIPEVEDFSEPKSVQEISELNAIIDMHYGENGVSNTRMREIRTFVTRMQRVICKEKKLSDARLEVFGSLYNGFGVNTSDVDICFRFESDTPPPDKEACSVIRKISSVLWKNAKDQRLFGIQSITTAKVPIVKFECDEPRLDGDISYYNVLALTNTQLLKAYCDWAPNRLPQLGLWVKKWAKHCDIGDASKGSLSSYSYIIMTIYYLQNCQPPVLPRLQEDFRTESDEPIWVDGWDVYFHRGRVDLDWSTNKQSAAELFIGFLDFFSKFDFKSKVIQIRRRKDLRKMEKDWRRPLCIEDPFDLNHNLGSGLSGRMFVHIVKTFINSRRVFMTGDARRNFLGRNRVDKVETAQQVQKYADFLLSNSVLGEAPCDRQCRYCKHIGHFADSCPQKQANRQHQQNRMRRDGGPREMNGGGGGRGQYYKAKYGNGGSRMNNWMRDSPDSHYGDPGPHRTPNARARGGAGSQQQRGRGRRGGHNQPNLLD